MDTFLLHWHGKKPNGEHPIWGRLQLIDAAGIHSGDYEEAVVYRTGDALEIHVHGGEQIGQAIEALFMQHGAVRKSWQKHFAAGTSQRDTALRLLPFAPTERTAQILLDQYNGALEREQQRLEHTKKIAEQEIVPLGRHLVKPFRVVLAGASNAGKSSLLNTILGFQRSLVHAVPGTTRDVVSGQTALDGFPVTFFDTAGFRETSDDLERQGIDRSLRSLAEADLIVWVIDSTVEEALQPPRPAGNNILVCYNKMDLVDEVSAKLPVAICRLPSAAGKTDTPFVSAFVSALTGEGIELLLGEIIHRLVPHPPKPGEAVFISE